MFPFGLDAPGVVRNFALGALACFGITALAHTDWLPVRITGLQWPGMVFAFIALSMLYGSQFGKIRRRNKLLNRLAWRGDEQVLDAGCGRGLYTVGAAQRAPQGHVTAIDIWQSEDQSGNSPDATRRALEREGVAGRVTLLTCDMRAITLPDASIDTVVSAWAIHNIYDDAGRRQAIAEILRVLRPGGQILIDDIRHVDAYAEQLRAAGCDANVSREAGDQFWRLLTFGSYGPATVIAIKPRQPH